MARRKKKTIRQKEVKPEGSVKDRSGKTPRRPAAVAGNKRQRKSFHMRGGLAH